MLERRVSLSRETNPRRDKNGVKPRENKIKDASSPASLVVDVGSISSLVKNLLMKFVGQQLKIGIMLFLKGKPNIIFLIEC